MHRFALRVVHHHVVVNQPHQLLHWFQLQRNIGLHLGRSDGLGSLELPHGHVVLEQALGAVVERRAQDFVDHLPAPSNQSLVDNHPLLVPEVIERSLFADVLAHVDHQVAAGTVRVEGVRDVIVDDEDLGRVFEQLASVALDGVLGLEIRITSEFVGLHGFRCHVPRTRKKKRGKPICRKSHERSQISEMACCTLRLCIRLEVFLNKLKKSQNRLQTCSVHVAV